MVADWIPRGRREWADGVGLYALALFAFFVPIGTAGANIWFGVMFLAVALAGPSRWALLRRDPVSIWLGAFLLYVVVRGAVAAQQFPATAAAQWPEISAWLKLLCPIVGLVMWRQLGKWWLVLVLFAAGFWVDLIYEAVTHWSQFVARTLDSFNRTRSSAGLYVVTALLGGIVFAVPFCGGARPRWSKALRILVWLLFLASMWQAMIVSQARGTWLAALVVFPLVIAAMLRRGTVPMFDRRHVIALLAVVVVAGGFFQFNKDLLSRRLGEEGKTIATLLNGDFEHIPYNQSVGQRAHVMVYGVEKWLERPWFGWGPADSKWLIQQHPQPAIAGLAHFHNGYIELLARLGIVGALLLLGMHVVLVRRFWRSYRAGAVPRTVLIFGMGVMGLLAVWSLSGFRMTHLDWRLYWLVLVGIMHGFTLTLIQPSPSPAMPVEARS